MLGVPNIYRMRCAATVLLTAGAVAIAACSGADSGPASAAPATAATVPTSAASSTTTTDSMDAPTIVVDDRGVEVVVESAERIIPLDGDLAEIVFALGLGDQVVATDLSATFPPAADAKPEIGYQRALAAEPILEYEPTVLLATDIAGPPETLADLERLGIPLVMVPTPTNADGPGTKIRAVAAALGVKDVGDALAAQVDADIDSVIASVPVRNTRPPLVAPLYLRGESIQLVLGTEMSIGWMLEALAVDNVATLLSVAETEPINIEALIELQPDVIITTQSGLASVGGIDGLLEIPGFVETPAGEQRRILAFEDQYLLGNGPRTADLLAELAAELHGPDAVTEVSTSTDSSPTPDEGTDQ